MSFTLSQDSVRVPADGGMTDRRHDDTRPVNIELFREVSPSRSCCQAYEWRSFDYGAIEAYLNRVPIPNSSYDVSGGQTGIALSTTSKKVGNGTHRLRTYSG